MFTNLNEKGKNREMSKPTGPKIKCPRCDGAGEIELVGALALTFSAVKKSRKATAPALHKALNHNGDLQVTTFNNRLNDLVGMGLLKRFRDGRTWIYEVA